MMMYGSRRYRTLWDRFGSLCLVRGKVYNYMCEEGRCVCMCVCGGEVCVYMCGGCGRVFMCGHVYVCEGEGVYNMY